MFVLLGEAAGSFGGKGLSVAKRPLYGVAGGGGDGGAEEEPGDLSHFWRPVSVLSSPGY